VIKNLLLILLCWSSIAQAQTRPWTDEERAWGVAFAAAAIADWSSTRYAARHDWPDNIRESNILLGNHPSTSRVDRHFAIGIPLVFFLLDNADENRKTGLIALTALEIYAAGNNAKLGLRFKF
jgi:hypothetical protein